MSIEKQTSQSNSTVRAVSRAFDILRIVVSAGSPISMTDICRQVKLPRPIAHRLLCTFMVGGYIYQTPHRKYALGTRLIPLPRYAGGALEVALRPILTKAVATLGESVSVAMLGQDYTRYISRVPPEHAWCMLAEVRNQVSFHVTGISKVILTAMPHAQALVTIKRTQLRAFTPATIADKGELVWKIELTREHSYAFDNGEHERGLRCVAVPVPGDLYLAVSVPAPAEHITGHLIRNSIIPTLYYTTGDIAGALSAKADRHPQP